MAALIHDAGYTPSEVAASLVVFGPGLVEPIGAAVCSIILRVGYSLPAENAFSLLMGAGHSIRSSVIACYTIYASPPELGNIPPYQILGE